MMKTLYYVVNVTDMKVLNHIIRDFHKDVYLKAELDMLDTFYEWGVNIEELNINSRDFKKQFFNFVSRSYIRYLNDNEGSRIFFIIGKPTISEIHSYVDKDEFRYAYFTNMKKMFKLFPMNAIIDHDFTYDEYMCEYNEEIVEILTTHIIKCRERNIKKSFKPLKSFIKTYDLMFLDHRIFNDLKSRFMFS